MVLCRPFRARILTQPTHPSRGGLNNYAPAGLASRGPRGSGLGGLNHYAPAGLASRGPQEIRTRWAQSLRACGACQQGAPGDPDSVGSIITRLRGLPAGGPRRSGLGGLNNYAPAGLAAGGPRGSGLGGLNHYAPAGLASRGPQEIRTRWAQ